MTAGEGDRSPAGLTEREAALLAILREAAAKGEPCPTNLSLAFGAGYRNPSTMAQVLGKLQRFGLIQIIGASTDRLVLIPETGDMTAPHRVRAAEHSTGAIARRVRSWSNPDDAPLAGEALRLRVAADQVRLRAERERWLDIEQQKYRLPKRGRPIERMPA